MKKAISAFCLLGATVALAACDTTGMGAVDTAPPYDMERTASMGKKAPAMEPEVAPAETVFRRAQNK